MVNNDALQTEWQTSIETLLSDIKAVQTEGKDMEADTTSVSRGRKRQGRQDALE